MEIEHVSEDCHCTGKKCTKCDLLLCVGKYTKDNRLKSKLKSQCKVCASADFNKWLENNRKYNNDRKKIWNAEHAEHVISLRKQRHLREYVRKTNKRAPSRNRTPEERREMQRENNIKQYHKNKQANKVRVMQYFHSRPGYRAVIESNRRARKREAGGAYTLQEWETLKARYDYTCLRCGRKEPEVQLHADHIIPVIKGGSSYIDNIQPLCQSCNSSKGKKFIDFRPKPLDN